MNLNFLIVWLIYVSFSIGFEGFWVMYGVVIM